MLSADRIFLGISLLALLTLLFFAGALLVYFGYFPYSLINAVAGEPAA